MLGSCATTLPAPQNEPAPSPDVQAMITVYLGRYFDMYPSQATAAGLHDLDTALEDFSPRRISEWIDFNRQSAQVIGTALVGDLSPDDALDAELVLRAMNEQFHRFETLRAPERNPLWWTDTIANANVFLLVRHDLPQNERLDRAVKRAENLPRLARQAEQILGRTDPVDIAPELARLAAGQARSTAVFYRLGFPAVDPGRDDLKPAGEAAATAIEHLADFLDDLATHATGSPLLGDQYEETFRLGTGITTPVNEILHQAEAT